MKSLFEDLKEGLNQAIAYEKEKGKTEGKDRVRVCRREIERERSSKKDDADWVEEQELFDAIFDDE